MSKPNPLEVVFFQEAEELLTQIEELALELTSGSSEEHINSLFRAFHTIKGSSSMFGMESVASFTHHVETTLDLARSGQLPVTAELADLVLSSRDEIKRRLDAAQQHKPVDQKQGQEIIDALEQLSGGSLEGISAISPTSSGTNGSTPA